MKISYFLQKNNNNLNAIRLILASMVIYGHAPGFIASAFGREDIFTKMLHFSYSGSVAVNTFFLISGLLVSNSLFTKRNWKIYLISRVFRLLPGLIVVSICTVVICAWFTTDTFEVYISEGLNYVTKNMVLDIQFVIENVSFIHDNYPSGGELATYINGSLWTIPYEFKMYLLVLAIWVISNVTSFKIIIPLALGVGMAYPLFSKSIIGLENTLYMIPAFGLGGILAYYKDKMEINFAFPAALVVIGEIITNDVISHLFVMLGVALFFVWLGSVAFICKFKISHDISYGVYLWGFIIEQLVAYLFPNLGYYAYVLLCLTCTFLIAYLSCILVEEPCQGIGKKICRYLQKNHCSFKV